jgi:hypothetical protein
MTANEFTGVKDIRGCFLYRTDGYIMSYLRVYFLNLDLLSEADRHAKTEVLTRSFESEKKNFVYEAYPREIDLDKYKNELKDRYKEELNHIGKRHILTIMLNEAIELASNGENFEHVHFIKLWTSPGRNRLDSEKELKDRLSDFQKRYTAVGVRTEILGEQEIIKMCALYGNAVQAVYDVPVNNLIYEQIGRL